MIGHWLTLQWNLPNFIAKHSWPVNPTDLNPIENIWSIIDKTTYKDPAPQNNEKVENGN